MGAVVTHVVVGMFVAAVAGVRTRYLPIAGLLSMALDLDHIFRGPGPTLPFEEPVWMMARATFHNLWIVAVIPALVAIYVYWERRGPADLRRIMVAAPGIMSSHTLFDMMAVHSGFPDNGSVPFYPFSMTRYSFDLRPLLETPAFLDALSLALLFALGLGLAARILATDIAVKESDTEQEERSLRLTLAGAYGGIFIVFLPIFTWATVTPLPY